MSAAVCLVGAGVGEAGLVTARAIECISRADTIVYDRLLDDSLLQLAKPDCERIYVGKQAGNHAMPQGEINRLLVDQALRGRRVVRLKGGDPYVFGRGGEEALFLRENGVEFETVPGVSSAVAGLCYAGIPVTHRGLATSFHVITGNTQSQNAGEIDWETLARLKGTLVFLMGLANLPLIAASLLQYGMRGDMPAAVVANAATARQQVVSSTLENLAEALAARPLPSPAMIVVGEAVALRPALCFYERKPLFGRTVALTRPEGDAPLRARLTDAGAHCLSLPLIRVEPLCSPPPCPLSELTARYTHLAFTSARAAELFFTRLAESGGDARRLAGLAVCAVGAATAAALRRHGIRADIQPERFHADALWKAIAPTLTPKSRVLVPCARAAWNPPHPICPIDRWPLYETRPDGENAARLAGLLREGDVNYTVFASPSAVQSLLDAPGGAEAARKTRAVAIGSSTAARLREAGLGSLEAAKAEPEELARVILADAQIRPQSD